MTLSRAATWVAACLAAALGCGDSGDGEDSDGSQRSPPAAGERIRFADGTEGSGLAAFVQENGNREKPYILESIGGGVAFLDHDGDGDLDVYLTNGSALEGFPPGEGPRDALFANDGSGTFGDVTEEVGLGDAGWTSGVRVADFDGDGWPDVFLCNFGPNVLYRNLRGRFEDVTAEVGLGDPRWGTGACFLDHDEDGDLDLYVVNYVHFDRAWIDANQPTQDYRGVKAYFGPRGLPGADDVFYRNGGTAFEDVSLEAGITGKERYGFQAVAFDYDLDGLLDIYVANDSKPNLLWRNEGDGSFEDTAFRAGLALSRGGIPQAGMGVAVGDLDGDGYLDLFVTNFSEDYFTLYRGGGDGYFDDVTHRLGLGAATMLSLGWGCAFADFDNDGDEDLFAANGHVYPQVDLFDLGTRYRQRNQLFENDGGTFRQVAPGGGLAVELCSRGAAFGDFDDDGDVDVLVGNLDDRPTLLVNESRDPGSWVKILLVGTESNRDAIGARIRLEAGGRTWIRTVGSSSGFLSSDDPRVHVGLGSATGIDELVVEWPRGRIETFRDLEVERLIRVVEGSGRVSSEALR